MSIASEPEYVTDTSKSTQQDCDNHDGGFTRAIVQCDKSRTQHSIKVGLRTLASHIKACSHLAPSHDYQRSVLSGNACEVTIQRNVYGLRGSGCTLDNTQPGQRRLIGIHTCTPISPATATIWAIRSCMLFSWSCTGDDGELGHWF
jgi:hypothetical protein